MTTDVTTDALLARPEAEIPNAMKATLVVLASPTLQGYVDIGRFVEFGPDENGIFDWPKALETGQTWSVGERLLVQLAATLWAPDNPTDLGSLIVNLDNNNIRRALLAVEVRRGLRPFREALVEAAANDKAP